MYNESPLLKDFFKDEDAFRKFLLEATEAIIRELKLNVDAGSLVDNVIERYRQIHEKLLFSQDRHLDPLIKKIREVFECVMKSHGFGRGAISNIILTILARIERILSLNR